MPCRSLAAPKLLSRTWAPFLHPRLHRSSASASTKRLLSTQASPVTVDPPDDYVSEQSNIDATDYSAAPFTDACTLTIGAGAGGHGCISFLREKYIANGPPNGGDGGYGGSVYVQAIRGETSLHKLARRGILKAGRGRNGQGSLKGGARGEDILITVPVGTVIREISRKDPLEEQDRRRSISGDLPHQTSHSAEAVDAPPLRRDKWLIYPGTLPKAFSSADFPAAPPSRRSNLAALQPPVPIRLDLDKSMDKPMLLAAGAVGGMGNPHFVTKSLPRPKFATKGDEGMRINLQLELKLLADVGLVGLPNAGKSTLLRALTKSRTRVGNWSFTTLSPSVGTVVLDDHTGRPALDTKGQYEETRTNFTIADIPGLIEDAHLDRGLGLGFLRHIERASVLAFVVDLSAGDAVEALKSLWREVSQYEMLREREVNAETERTLSRQDGTTAFKPFESSISPGFDPEPVDAGVETALLNAVEGRALPPLSTPPLSSKPWLVVATKADLHETQGNFAKLQTYLEAVQEALEAHPSGGKNAWRKRLYAVPVSAINKEGVSRIPGLILNLLNGQ